MLSDLTKKADQLEARFSGRIGLLYSPIVYKNPLGMPYAFDNGRFTVWKNGKMWDEEKFFKLLTKPQKAGYRPRWTVVPDVVADAGGTFQQWRQWVPILRPYDTPLALAVQDGMSVKDVLELRPQPDVIFVGGTMTWKWRYAKDWCRHFPRVHIARVGSARKLWMAQRIGAESTDGTAWFRDDERQAQLLRYLTRSSLGLGEMDVKGFFY